MTLFHGFKITHLEPIVLYLLLSLAASEALLALFIVLQWLSTGGGSIPSPTTSNNKTDTNLKHLVPLNCLDFWFQGCWKAEKMVQR